MYLNSFFVNRSEGIKFAKLSGDDNLIHLSKTAGYNSIYGHDSFLVDMDKFSPVIGKFFESCST